MLRRHLLFYAPIVAALFMTSKTSTAAAAVTTLSGDRTTTLEHSRSEGDALWVRAEDLPLVNGFELKPEGACIAEICIPINDSISSELMDKRDGQTWIDAAGLSRKAGQPYVTDAEANTWSFGPISGELASSPYSVQAPDFALPDRDGNMVRLSDFRGKKVLLLTWASW